MALLIECLVGVVLFALIAIPVTLSDPLGALGDYPPAIRERCIELGLIEDRPRRFTTADYLRKGAGMLLFALCIALILRHFNGDRTFFEGFRDAYVIWFVVDWFDALVVDCGWFCHTPRVRIPGTEDMAEYHDYLFHIQQSCIGMLLGIPTCLLVGAIVQAL